MISFDEVVISAMKLVTPSVVNIAKVTLVRDYYYRIIPIKGGGLYHLLKGWKGPSSPINFSDVRLIIPA